MELHPKVTPKNAEIIDLMEYLPPAARAQIGPQGGMLEIQDKQSPIHGFKLNIPAGALTRNEEITIRIRQSPGAFSIGPAVRLSPNGLKFKHPVTVQMKCAPQTKTENEVSDDTNLTIFHSDSNQPDWMMHDQSEFMQKSNTITCELTHF